MGLFDFIVEGSIDYLGEDWSLYFPILKDLMNHIIHVS